MIDTSFFVQCENCKYCSKHFWGLFCEQHNIQIDNPKKGGCTWGSELYGERRGRMIEHYRSATVCMTANIDVLVNDGMTEEEQEQKLVDLAIDYVQCLGDGDIHFEYAEFND